MLRMTKRIPIVIQFDMPNNIKYLFLICFLSLIPITILPAQAQMQISKNTEALRRWNSKIPYKNLTDIEMVVSFLGSNLQDQSIPKKDSPYCADSEFGMRFMCEADWKWRRIDSALLIIISTNPTVTLTITRFNSSLTYLQQLTHEYLAGKDLYLDDFRTEDVTFAGNRAVKVKAFSKKYPDIRLTDYYVMHNGNLYGVMFTVYPKEHWDEYQYMVQKISDSFSFLEDLTLKEAKVRSYEN